MPSFSSLAVHVAVRQKAGCMLGMRLVKGMACQKVCKQGRNDIIVKVNLQSHLFTLQLQTCENDAGMRLCKFTFTIISSLPYLHTFWHAIPTSFYTPQTRGPRTKCPLPGQDVPHCEVPTSLSSDGKLRVGSENKAG